MRSTTARFSILLLLVALALPSVGPLVDHHFAELQPSHGHLGPPQHHTHSYQHAHGHTPNGGADTGGQPTVLLNYESGTAPTVVVVINDMAMQSSTLFEPTSLFLLPAPAQSQPKDNYRAPPKRPPRHLL